METLPTSSCLLAHDPIHGQPSVSTPGGHGEAIESNWFIPKPPIWGAGFVSGPVWST